MGIESQPLGERLFPEISFYWEWLNNQLRTVLIHATGLCLSSLGYECKISSDCYIINITGFRGVAIGNYCLAFQFMFFFSSLILISPFPARVKLWSIPLGLTAIQALNVFRFVGLSLVIVHFPGWEVKMHNYFFNTSVLVVTLVIYMKLLSKYG